LRASLEVADIFRAEGTGYHAAQAGHLSLAQLKVMSAIENCRTAALGGHVDACEDCGHWRIAYTGRRASERLLVGAMVTRMARAGNGSTEPYLLTSR
jgi:hypothetical protein